MVPDQIHECVSALADVSNSNLVSLFCLVTKKSADDFAKYITRLDDLTSNDKTLTYADAYAAYKDVDSYLEIFKNREPALFNIKPKQYLNLNQENEFRVDPYEIETALVEEDLS